MKRRTGFGLRLTQARDSAGLTQQQLADLLGIKQQAIHKLEAGINKNCKQELILEIAEKLSVSPSWLALGIEELDRSSDNALRVAVNFDKLPIEGQNEIWAVVARYTTPLPGEQPHASR